MTKKFYFFALSRHVWRRRGDEKENRITRETIRSNNEHLALIELELLGAADVWDVAEGEGRMNLSN